MLNSIAYIFLSLSKKDKVINNDTHNNHKIDVGKVYDISLASKIKKLFNLSM